MKFYSKKPARSYTVGEQKDIVIKDCGHLYLRPNEQVTLMTEQKAEYDVARKDWGFYATPSLNGRLRSFGLRACLVRNQNKKYYIFLMEKGKSAAFHRYLKKERQVLISWLDNDADLRKIERIKHPHIGS